jgi:hypothetical protein
MLFLLISVKVTVVLMASNANAPTSNNVVHAYTEHIVLPTAIVAAVNVVCMVRADY